MRVGKECEAGDRYLDSLSRSERRRSGVVYTPPHLVQFILDEAGYLPKKALQNVTLLDPACGAGAFLAAALERLAASLAEQGATVRSKQGRAELERLVRANLAGVDVDREACRLARRALTDRFETLTGARPSRGAFTRNVLCGDFLERNGAVRARVENAFDLIVGNPPYVTTTRLSNGQKARFRERYECAHGRIDLYQLFVEQTIRDLPPGGRLAFITPNKFLTSQSGKMLRSILLRSGAVNVIANFSSHRVFEGAATVPCVTVFEKGASPSVVQSMECGSKSTASGEESGVGTAFISGADSIRWLFSSRQTRGSALCPAAGRCSPSWLAALRFTSVKHLPAA